MTDGGGGWIELLENDTLRQVLHAEDADESTLLVDDSQRREARALHETRCMENRRGRRDGVALTRRDSTEAHRIFPVVFWMKGFVTCSVPLAKGLAALVIYNYFDKIGQGFDIVVVVTNDAGSDKRTSR